MTYITEEIRARIGVAGARVTAARPLGPDELRRFVQGAMIDDPIHWDEPAARARGFPGVVAPPLFPINALRRADGTADPLSRLADEPDWDGAKGVSILPGLDLLQLPLKRLLNGGVTADFFQLACVGDLISFQSRYVDIVEREGKSGTMVVAKAQTEYTNQQGALLARVRMTLIFR